MQITINKNLAILISLIFLFSAMYFLYWKGETDLKRASEKFTVLAFENASLDCNKNSLKFFIENNLPREKEYEILILINQEKVASHSNFKIPARTTRFIELESVLLDKICQEQANFKFEAEVKNKEIKENIYKFIN